MKLKPKKSQEYGETRGPLEHCDVVKARVLRREAARVLKDLVVGLDVRRELAEQVRHGRMVEVSLGGGELREEQHHHGPDLVVAVGVFHHLIC